MKIIIIIKMKNNCQVVLTHLMNMTKKKKIIFYI